MNVDPIEFDDFRYDRVQLTGSPITKRFRPLVLPGAFDPLHDGHRRMAAVAAEICEADIDFELSIRNVDKAEISLDEVARRIQPFEQEQILWMTRAATFAEKAAIFPATTFVIGADTAIRLANLGYYQGDRAGRDAALALIRSRDCRFVVFGRLINGAYQGLDDLPLPQEWKSLCRGVSEKRFRMDISSTELRGE